MEITLAKGGYNNLAHMNLEEFEILKMKIIKADKSFYPHSSWVGHSTLESNADGAHDECISLKQQILF